jgi:protein phosphatase
VIYRTASGGVSVEVAARLFRGRGSWDEDALLIAEMQGRGVFEAPVHELDLTTASGLVLGAFDGTGPAVSRWAAEHVARLLGAPLSPLDAISMRDRLLAVFKETARRAAAAIRARTLTGMGTTATVAVAVRQALVLAHVGDSRAYLWRRGRLVQATRDDLHPYVDVLELRRGDRLLLCTDELHRALGDAAIGEALGGSGGARPACDALMDSAVKAGRGNVDVGVAVAHFNDAMLMSPTEADALADWSNDAIHDRLGRRGARARRRGGPL